MAQDATAFFRRAKPGLPYYYSISDLAYAYYSSYSGLTPAEKFSRSDHQYAFYCSALKLDRGYTMTRLSINDLEQMYYKSLGIDTSQGMGFAENTWHAGNPPRVNLVNNPSLDGPAGLTTKWFGPASNGTSDYSTGKLIKTWIAPTAANADTGIAQIIPVTPGLSYTFSGVGSCSVASSMQVYAQFKDSAYVNLGTRFINTYALIPANTTANPQLIAIAPAGAAFVEFALGPFQVPVAMAVSDTITLDSMLMEQSDTIGSYFDGNTPGAVWNGTPGNSSSTLLTKPRVNLMLNPSLESNIGGWGAWGGSGATISSAREAGSLINRSGGYRYKTTWTVASIAIEGGSYCAGTSVTPGVTYAVSQYVQPSKDILMQARIEWYTPSSTQISTVFGPSVLARAGVATRLTAVGVAPVGAVTVNTPAYSAVGEGQQFWQAGDWLYSDDLLIEESTVVGTYFDGSTAGAIWLGAPNNSASQLVDDVRTNLMLSPSFESGINNWISAGAVAVPSWETTLGFSGTSSLKIVNDGAVIDQGVFLSGTRPVIQPNTTYTVSVRMLCNVGNTIYLEVGELDSVNGLIGSRRKSSALAGTGKWETFAVTFTSVSWAAYVDIVVRNQNAVPNVTYLDAVLPEANSAVGTYFDGDFPNAVWNGTPHASTSTMTTPIAYPHLWTAGT